MQPTEKLQTPKNKFQTKQLIITKKLNTQPSSSSRPSRNLWWKKIHIYVLDTARNVFANTTNDKFQDQLILIWLMQTNRLTIKKANMVTKTAKDNTWQIINRRNFYNFWKLHCSSIIQ